MKVGFHFADLFLVALIFVTSFYALAWFAVYPESYCLTHHTEDCPNLESNNSGPLALMTSSENRVNKAAVVWPASLPQLLSIEFNGLPISAKTAPPPVETNLNTLAVKHIALRI
jgi:hypothetical protein